MRPYNTYRNPELSQPVSSVENTLTDRTSSNASFDLLRSLSESISVDCGSFEISEPTEYYQPTSAPSHVAFVDPRGKEIRTPVESAPAAPVKSEPAKMMQTSIKPSVNPAPDMDDDNYDCMNDPNYRTQCVKEAQCVKEKQCVKETDSPSFEELLARTAESIAKMREETQAASTNPGNGELREKRDYANNANASQPQTRTQTESVINAPKQETKSATDSQSESSAKKGFLSSIGWDKTRKLLFSRESIKLTLLSIAISALIVSAVIYKNSTHRNNGLSETNDVVMNQSTNEIQNVPVQENGSTLNNNLNSTDNGDYWNQQAGKNWDSSLDPNPQALTDQIRDDYQSPTFDGNLNEYEYSQNGAEGYLNSEDTGRPLASPHSANNVNQFVDVMPAYNPGPQYAEVSPAFGSQYNPNDYESPVLEDDTVSGYSETGYNSNYMR